MSTKTVKYTENACTKAYYRLLFHLCCAVLNAVQNINEAQTLNALHAFQSSIQLAILCRFIKVYSSIYVPAVVSFCFVLFLLFFSLSILTMSNDDMQKKFHWPVSEWRCGRFKECHYLHRWTRMTLQFFNQQSSHQAIFC